GAGRMTIDSPENVAAFDWIQGYAKEYGSENLQTFRAGFGNFGSPQNPFMSGTLAMALQGVWMGKYVREYAPNIEWGAAPMPSTKAGEDPVTWLACDILVVPKGAKHPAEAADFIAFVNRQDNIEELNLGHEKTSPLRKVSEDFYRRHKNPYIRMFQKLGWSKN